MPRLALTPGEPAGIGPDLTVLLAERARDYELVVVGDAEMLEARARTLGLALETAAFDAARPAERAPHRLSVLHVPAVQPPRPGQLDAANAPYVLETLRQATAGCLDGRFDALVTGPLHKGVINEAGIPFSGHTEFLAELTGTPRVVMLLVGGGLRVALATTHLPLKDVAGALTPALLREVIEILHRDLREKFGFSDPHIAVAGLNPHAGEGGHLGREEIEVIAPVLDALRAQGMRLWGPLPADTLFNHLDGVDVVLAMYHDQGLPVLKYASFGEGVNLTLGLPIIRTSVDHGTALQLAGTGNIHGGSLDAAVEYAQDLARRWSRA